ncbi:MAG: DUF418 domain-containing protein [Acidobacteriota bacterium]
MSRGHDAAVGPVAAGERIEVLDALRGFALLLIFTFNVFIYSGSDFLGARAAELSTYGLDEIVRFLRRMLVENKGLSLFSLMFGLGFGIMARRAAVRGVAFVPLFLRRQAILLLLGLAHGILLWGGDILVVYAVLSLLIVPFHRASPRVIAIVAVLVYLLPIPLYAASLSLDPPPPHAFQLAAEWTGEPNLFGLWMNGWAGDDVVGLIKGNLAFLVFWWTMVVANLYWPDILGMFLIGVFIVRSGWLDRLATEPKALSGRWILGAGVLGLGGNFAFARGMQSDVYYPPSVAGLWMTVVQYLTVPMLCFFYAAGLVWLYHHGAARVLRAVADVGRMTLSLYVAQSLLCLVVFYGVGLGYFLKVGAAVAVAIALALYGLEMLFARWWWSRGFAFGPLEWIWRQATYGRRLPLRASRET